MKRRAFLKTAAGIFVPTTFAIGQGLTLRNPAFVAAFKAAAGGGGSGPYNLYVSHTGGSTTAVNTYQGCKITVGASPISVTQIGVYLAAADGYTTAAVAIFSDLAGTAVKSTTIDLSGGNNTVGLHYSSAFTAVVLSASTTYYLGVQSNYQSILNAGCVVTTSADATIVESAYGDATAITAVSGDGTGHSYGPIDLVYTK